ncbi:MAG: LamG domain-containing protein, partial [Treponema sp.]|nr:LamG domain-containing protein [Treponema sp.]
MAISGSLYGVDEKTIVIGGNSAWDMVEKRNGIIELTRLRPHPVLALSSTAAGSSVSAENGFLDLALSFDEARPELFTDKTGHYRIMVNPQPDLAENAALQAADRRWARAGTGAALFSGAGVSAGAGGAGSPLMIEPRTGDALFAPDNQIRDFTLEFWLYPLNMANGEQILTWISSRPLPRQEDAEAVNSGREYAFQRIQCIAVKNRLQWTFLDLFTGSGNSRHINLTLSGDTPVVPKTWSHHLIRFDADTGLLEYLVNGKAEAIEYATPTGREGGEVYTPLMGEGGSFMLGNRFMGLLDEFKIYRTYIGSAETRKYSPRGGRMETRPIDLGQGGSGILKVEALGGRTSVSGGIIQNDYAGYESPSSGRQDFRFADDSALQFFIRAAGSPYSWAAADWRPFIPGTALAGDFRGRYIQVAVDFYPSGDCETSPYLEEIRVTYRPDEPPAPPSMITALARDGAVALNWKPSPDADTLG